MNSWDKYHLVLQTANKEGYKLITDHPLTASEKYQFICPKGHDYHCIRRHFLNGSRCLLCSGIKKTKHQYEQEFKTLNHKLVQFNKSCVIQCVKCNREKRGTAADLLYRIKRYRCGGCKSLESQEKKKSSQVLKDTSPKPKKKSNHILMSKKDNHSKDIKPQISVEAKDALVSLRDYYINRGLSPEIHEGILHFPKVGYAVSISHFSTHTEKHVHQNYHLNLMIFLREWDVKLIQIFEDEFYQRIDQVLNYLNSKLGLNKKVYARSCKFKEVEPALARQFQDENHIQGFGAAKYHFGLFQNQTLMQMISINKHHRQNSTDWLLSRMCSRANHQIIGGTSKLLYNSLKTVGINEISTFADLRYSEGDVYQKLGFNVVHQLPPDYSYVKNGERFGKQSKKKTAEEKSSGKTERELRKEQGFERIYDCGKIKFRIDLS